MTYEEIIKFHGHECPGIAIGYRMATAAMESLTEFRANDEELVAIVENDACGVDALQCITGCTFGKGNLIFHDYGKQVYTIFSRTSRIGVRVVFHGTKIPQYLWENRTEFCKWLRSAPREDFLSTTQVSISEPKHAKIRKSVNCAFCGESVMESRIKKFDEKPACIPCYQKES